MKTEPPLEQLEAVFGNAPITPKGYKWVVERTDCYEKGWVSVNENEWIHCPEYRLKAIKTAQPTTLADLVGKHGQNNVWLHTSSEGAFAALVDFRDGRIHYVDGKMIECLIKYNYRWSNDPFTKYADAKEFIPE